MTQSPDQRLASLARSLRPGAVGAGLKSFAPVLAGIALAFVLQHYCRIPIGDYPAKLLLDIGIAVVLAVSLNIVNGFTGQFSMGHAGFMAVGGYVSGMVTYYGSIKIWAAAAAQSGALSTMKPDISGMALFGGGEPLFLVAILAGGFVAAIDKEDEVDEAGGLVAAITGLAVGLPSLRLKGDYLAIVTLGFGEIVRVLVQQTLPVMKPQSVAWNLVHPDSPAPAGVEKVAAFVSERLNTTTGMTENVYTAVSEASWVMMAPHVGGALGFNGIPKYNSLFWVYSAVALTLVTAYRLKTSTFGRAFLSIREDEVAAEAMGVNTTRFKVTAFVVAAFFAGVAGALASHTLGVGLGAETAGFQRSFDVIIMVVLGGLGSISGAVIAAAVVTLLPEWLRPIAEYRMIVFALALILMMIFRPKGLFGVHEIWDRAAWDWLLGRKSPGGGKP
ncbi:MAG: branched-chain amino acid ABC transporter permease [Phycisphaerales bacterium]